MTIVLQKEMYAALLNHTLFEGCFVKSYIVLNIFLKSTMKINSTV